MSEFSTLSIVQSLQPLAYLRFRYPICWQDLITQLDVIALQDLIRSLGCCRKQQSHSHAFVVLPAKDEAAQHLKKLASVNPALLQQVQS